MQEIAVSLTQFSPEKIRQLTNIYETLLLELCVLPSDQFAEKIKNSVFLIAAREPIHEPIRLREEALRMLGIRVAC